MCVCVCRITGWRGELRPKTNLQRLVRYTRKRSRSNRSSSTWIRNPECWTPTPREEEPGAKVSGLGVLCCYTKCINSVTQSSYRSWTFGKVWDFEGKFQGLGKSWIFFCFCFLWVVCENKIYRISKLLCIKDCVWDAYFTLDPIKQEIGGME